MSEQITNENGKTVQFPEKKPAREGKVTIRANQCKGCGLCIRSCPKKILETGSVLNTLGYAATVVAKAGCIGCGNCFYTCPEPDAIQLIVIRNEEAKKTA